MYSFGGLSKAELNKERKNLINTLTKCRKTVISKKDACMTACKNYGKFCKYSPLKNCFSGKKVHPDNKNKMKYDCCCSCRRNLYSCVECDSSDKVCKYDPKKDEPEILDDGITKVGNKKISKKFIKKMKNIDTKYKKLQDSHKKIIQDSKDEKEKLKNKLNKLKEDSELEKRALKLKIGKMTEKNKELASGLKKKIADITKKHQLEKNSIKQEKLT